MKFNENILTITTNLKMPLLKLPTKMTVVRINGNVILISPARHLERFKAEIDAFGTVTDIVAPNLFHNLGLVGAHELFPKAKMWGPKGLKEKLPHLRVEGVLTAESWPYQKELPLFKVEGMPKMNEVVFLHCSSKTLIVTDLCFNHIHGKGIGYWIIFKMFGTYKRFAVSKFFLKMVKDKQAFASSVKNILKEDFDNIILPHGESIIGKARDLLTSSFKERGVI